MISELLQANEPNLYLGREFGVWESVIWNEEPDGKVEHIRDNDLSIDDIEHVIVNYRSKTLSRTTGNLCVFGYTPDGRYIIVVLEEIDNDTVYPITAYAVAEPLK